MREEKEKDVEELADEGKREGGRGQDKCTQFLVKNRLITVA